jgi:hypothetical protein
MRKLRVMALAGVLALVGTVSIGNAGAAPAAKPSHNDRRTIVPDMVRHKNYGTGTSQAFPSAQEPDYLHSSEECSVKKRVPTNLRLDCDGIAPNNEPDLEVNPENPLHIIGSSNDYESCCDQWYTTFDGGKTWRTGDMSAEGPNRIGSDPVTVFDPIRDTALHFSLNFVCGEFECGDGDLVVSISNDGGITWGRPIQIADGVGNDFDSFQLFHDKEWGVMDTNPSSPFYGRAYVTWSGFVSEFGEYRSSAIYESHSDNGGHTWTAPKVISGSNPALCTFQVSGPAGQCDQNQFSVPTIGPDGTVYVAFENEQNEALWEGGGMFDNQYLLVKSTNGGQSFSNPTFVTGMEDGSNDYPTNVVGRQTLTGYQVRVNSAGNVFADPANGNLYLTFSDNRNGVHNSANPRTNTDVFLMRSNNGGASWEGPWQISTGSRDQWFPWVEVDPVSGKVGVLYHDRTSAVNYHTTLAEGTPGGSWTFRRVSSAPSDPVHSLFFQAGVPGCEECATFHGDYNALAYGSDGFANTAYTDMRELFDDTNLHKQFIYFTRLP